MTLDDLQAKTDALGTLRDAWVDEILPVVASKLEDATAHAGKAMGTTARKARQSPAFAMAKARLDELLTWLEGQIGDARESFYREATKLHQLLIPKELLGTSKPTAENLALMRKAEIHGYTLRAELKGPVDRAKQGLLVTVNTGNPKALDTWHKQHLAALDALVLRALSDSAVFADSEAGSDLIHPDFRESEDVEL